MIDQLTLPSNPPSSQNTNTNPSNTSNPPLFLDLSANLMAAPSNAEIMKIYKLPIEEILPLDPALGIRRALTIDSKFICYINTENSVVIKSIDYAFLSFTVRGPQAQVMDVCLFEGVNFSVLGIMYKDGTLSGYQIGINEASSSIIVRHFLGYKIEGIIERPLIMWKDLSKIGVCLRNELILIEVSVEGGEKTKEFEQELKPNNFKVLSFDENIKDFCFSPKYHLVYLLFENNVVKVINTENGLEIRGFQPHPSSPSANIMRLLSFKNLAKKGGSLTNAASQKPEINKDHDYSLKDIFITVTEAGEIKVWDLSEWDNKAKTYYCVEELNLNENNEVEMKLAFSFFDPGRNGLYLVYSQGEEKGLSVAVLGINSFFHCYQENYKDLKKSNKFFTSTERIALKEEKLMDIAALNAKGNLNEEKEKELASNGNNIQIQTSGPKAKYNFVILTHKLASFVSVFASMNFPQLPQRKFSTQILKKPSDSPMRRSNSHHDLSPKILPWEPRNLDKILADLKIDENILKRVLEGSTHTPAIILQNIEEQKLDLLVPPPVALFKAKSDTYAQNNLLSFDVPASQDNEKESPSTSTSKKSPSKKKKANTMIVVQAPVTGSGEIIPSDPTPLEASVLDIPEAPVAGKKSKKKKKKEKEAAALALVAAAKKSSAGAESSENSPLESIDKLELTIPNSKKSKNKMTLPLLSPTQSTPDECDPTPDPKKSKVDYKKAVSPVSSVASEIGAGKKIVVRQDQVGENVKQWVQGFVDKKVVGFEKKMGNIDELIEKKFIEKVESKLQAIEQRVIAKAQETMQKNLSKALEKPYQSINRINQINQQMKQAFENEKKGYQQKIKQQEDQLKIFKEEVNQTLNSFTQIMTVTLQSLSKSQSKVQELEQSLQTKSSEVSSLIQYTKVMLQQEEEYHNRVHNLEKNVQFIAKECLARLEASVQETSSPSKTIESATPSIQFVPNPELIKEADISDNYKKVVQEIFDSVRQMNTPEQINQSLAHITNSLPNNNPLQTLLENNNTELSRRSSTQSQLQTPLTNPLVNFQQAAILQFSSVNPSGTSPKQAEKGGFVGPLEFNKDPVLLFQEALIGQGSFNLEGIHQHPTKSRFKVNFVDSSNASVKDGFEESEDRPESELSRPPGLDYYSESGESLDNLLPRDLLLDDIKE